MHACALLGFHHAKFYVPVYYHVNYCKAERAVVQCQRKVLKKCSIIILNVQLKQLLQKHNNLCRDFTTKHKDCLEINHEITRFTEDRRRQLGTPWKGFWNLNTPGRNGMQCTPYWGRSLTPPECRYCTEVECMSVTAQRPQFHSRVEDIKP